MAFTTKRIEGEYADRSTVGTLGLSTAASRRHWSSLTPDGSAPTLATEGKETLNARKALIDVKCVAGTSADFALYGFYGNSETWAPLTAYGTSGTYQVLAGAQHAEQIDIPCGVTRIHLQCVTKGGSPTEISGWVTLGFGG